MRLVGEPEDALSRRVEPPATLPDEASDTEADLRDHIDTKANLAETDQEPNPGLDEPDHAKAYLRKHDDPLCVHLAHGDPALSAKVFDRNGWITADRKHRYHLVTSVYREDHQRDRSRNHDQEQLEETSHIGHPTSADAGFPPGFSPAHHTVEPMANLRYTELTSCETSGAVGVVIDPNNPERIVREISPAASTDFYFVTRPSMRRRVYLAAFAFARLTVLALYLFPLLVLAKIVFWAMHDARGEWLTIGFVAVVLLVGAGLSLVLLTYPFGGPRSKKGTVRQFRWPSHDSAAQHPLGQTKIGNIPLRAGRELETALPSAQQQLPQPIRLRGIARAYADRDSGGALVTDAWEVDAKVCSRFFSGCALVIEGPEQPPVVVAFDAAPWIVANYSSRRPSQSPPSSLAVDISSPLAEATRSFAIAMEGARTFEIRDGDEIEIVAPVGATVADINAIRIDGQPYHRAQGAGPYRGHTTAALLLEVTGSAPLLLLTPRP